jgi:hypothetical protein
MRLGADVCGRVSSVTIVTGSCSGRIERLRQFQNFANDSIVQQETCSMIIGSYFVGVKVTGA